MWKRVKGQNYRAWCLPYGNSKLLYLIRNICRDKGLGIWVEWLKHCTLPSKTVSYMKKGKEYLLSCYCLSKLCRVINRSLSNKKWDRYVYLKKRTSQKHTYIILNNKYITQIIYIYI